MGELRQLNEQNKLAIWAERVTECRNSGQSVLAWCKEHGICSQTYYKWQKRLFSVGKTAIVVIDTKCACWLCYFAACAWGVDSYLVSMTSMVYTK